MMTRAEAIERLENDWFFDWYGQFCVNKQDSCEFQTALDVAIAALREQDATDTNVGHKNEWISVKERLPEDGVDVLTRRATGMNVETHHSFGWAYDAYNGRWEVTHWMPLPEPPEGGADHA